MIRTLVLRSEPAWLLAGRLCLSIFSSHWSDMGVPVPVDRLVILAGCALVLWRLWLERRTPGLPTIRLEPVHLLLAAAFTWALGSAIWAENLGDRLSNFALLDSFGLVPFLLFVLGPVAFYWSRQRRIFTGLLIVTGAYLGVTGLLETIGLEALVFPRYINDPSIGLHFGRARGPLVSGGAF